MKLNIFGLILNVLLFLIFILLAFMFQSTKYLYVASFFPLVIVPFLPDIRSNQYIRSDKDNAHVHLFKIQGQEASSSDLFVIVFEPGYINWRKKTIYFNSEEASVCTSLRQDPYTAAMPVLKYDLTRHPRKKNQVGISLPNLIQRTSQLSYTTEEINRFVIRMEDLNELIGRSSSRKSSVNTSVKRDMQA
jgi:hypothetical protein